MTPEQRHRLEQSIAADLEKCDIGEALTTGKLRRRYAAHRKKCMKAIHQMNVEDGLADISDEELASSLAELNDTEK